MKITIYTDGSCYYKTKLGGWACILIYDNWITKELSGPLFDTTTSRAELQAIIVALSSLKGTGHEVELFTDSEYAIKVIRGISRPKFNHDLIETIQELVSRHQVTPRHVRGHAGNPFNERCDYLAGQAYKAAVAQSPSKESSATSQPQSVPVKERKPIYVDPLMPFGWILHGREIESCHMFTEDDDLSGLHELAIKIGLKPSWFQKNNKDKDGNKKIGVPHYDLTPAKRSLAVQRGAVEIGSYEAGMMFHEIKNRIRESGG